MFVVNISTVTKLLNLPRLIHLNRIVRIYDSTDLSNIGIVAKISMTGLRAAMSIQVHTHGPAVAFPASRRPLDLCVP